MDLLHASEAFRKGFVAGVLGLGFRCCSEFTAFESSKGITNGSTSGPIFTEDLTENIDFRPSSGCKGRPGPGEKFAFETWY